MSHCYVLLLGGLNKICVEFLVEQRFLLVEQTCRCHVLCEENFNCLVNHGHSVETFCLLTKFRLESDILHGV